MTLRKSALLPLLALLASLAACGLDPYTVTFNDNVLYSPNEALKTGLLEDPALQGCLNQVLQNSELEAETLTLLACPAAGVESLMGIDALASLEQLELSGNSISNLAPLSTLKNLRVLSIRNNAVADIGLLDDFPLLRFVALEGNDRIPCRQLDNLQQKLGSTLGRPQDCVN